MKDVIPENTLTEEAKNELNKNKKSKKTVFSDHFNLKILTPKQRLQRLSIAPVQAKSGNTSGNLLNEIRQIIYSFYRAKEITKKVYNNIMNSIKNKYYIYEF